MVADDRDDRAGGDDERAGDDRDEWAVAEDGESEPGLNPEYGAKVRFGDAADDYGDHRAPYPEELFERLVDRGAGDPGQSVLDVGCGTGFLARGLARRGCDAVGMDLDRALLAEAARTDLFAEASEAARTAAPEATTAEANSSDSAGTTAYVRGVAEHLPFPADAFDVVTAGQCWHWFERDRAAREVRRVLRPAGTLVITHFDWLPREDNVVAATEDLILEWSPDWPAAGGDGFHTAWLDDVHAAGFRDPETVTFDVDVPYTHAGWRGRIRASAGVGGSLPPAEVRAFDDALADLLAERFPQEPLAVPHRSFTLVCEAPER